MMAVMSELMMCDLSVVFGINSCRHAAFLAAVGVVEAITITFRWMLPVTLEVVIDLLPGQVSETIREELIDPSFGVCPSLLERTIFACILVNQLEVFIVCAVVMVWIVERWSFFDCVNIDVHDPSDRGLFRSVRLLRFVGGLAVARPIVCDKSM